MSGGNGCISRRLAVRFSWVLAVLYVVSFLGVFWVF